MSICFNNCDCGQIAGHWKSCPAYSSNERQVTPYDNHLQDIKHYLSLDNAPAHFKRIQEHLDMLKKFSTPQFHLKRCECGADSIGVNNHSSWCNKYGD